MSTYCKYCFVRACSTNSRRNPDKFLFRVPYNKEVRRNWCLAVGRDPETLSYASAAFCCSDHFNMALDLNRIASTSTVPVLKSDVLPTLERHENQMQIVQADNVPENNGPKNLFVREVVYIEENYNDRFLEEANDIEDTLNIEPDCNATDSTAQDIIEILDDEKPAEPSSANKTTDTTIPKKIVLYKSKDTATPIHYAPLKGLPNKPLILRHIKQLNSVGNQNAVKFIPVSSTKSIPDTIQLNQPKVKVIPETVVSKAAVPQPPKHPALVTVRPIDSVTPKTFLINKSKYLKVNEINKLKNEATVERGVPPSDDDDCVVVEEQNVLSNIKETVAARSTDPSVKILKTLPPSISVKSVSNRGYTKIVRPPKPAVKEPLEQPAPTSSNAIVPIQPALRVRDFGKISDKPDVNQDKTFNLIKLMITENQLLLGRHMGQLVKIARTHPNEFKIVNTIYYFRTNDEFEKNYFFMNITRQSSHINEIIQRCYSIYWGNPRRNCVGVVETKGPLDDAMKDFVFQQVKKSLFNEKSLQNVNLTQQVQPAPLVLHNMTSPSRAPKSVFVGVKPIKMPVVKPINMPVVKPIEMPVVKPIQDFAVKPIKGLAAKPIRVQIITKPVTKEDPNNVIILDDDRNIMPVAVQQRHIQEVSVKSPISTNAVPSKAIKNIAVQSSISTNTATPKTSSDVFQTRPIIKKLSSSEKATVKKAPPRFKSNKKQSTKLQQKEANANNELIRLSQFLTPNIRKLINKLKYFELSNGKVFTVKVGDSMSTDKPFNIVFTENKPQYLVDIKARPVSKFLYVSKLVNYLFKAIYPYMQNRSDEPIRIPPPQDIVSDATPALMNALSMSESKRTFKQIAKLEASVNNSHTAQDTSDFKHKCQICSQTFQRRYQLQRHKFVTHDSKPVEQSSGSSPSSGSNVWKITPATIGTEFQQEDEEEESYPNELPLITSIKREEPEEIIDSDRSLLVPLYEEQTNETGGQIPVNISSVKEEPEELIEEMTALPLTPEGGSRTSNRSKRKNRKFASDDEDETDSAPECFESFNGHVLTKKARKIKLKNGVALGQPKQVKKKNIAKVKKAKMNRKIMRTHRIDGTKMVAAMPIKISRAEELMKTWPSLKLALVDINHKNVK